MAAIYDKDKIKQAAGVVSGTQDIGNNAGTMQLPSYATNNHYTGLNGVSGATAAQLGKYTQGYTPSQSVVQAQDYLNSVVSGKPGTYQSNYKQQLDDLYSQVMNRPKFSYDLNGDMLYQQYRDQYANLGRQAMMDTTAQAAALTGGYGNSYAATAGNQAYQAYLQQLNNIVPDLYQMALNRYQQEGDDLNTKYAITSELEGKDYSRYQDDYNKWLTERDYANSDYWNKYNADYGQYGDERNFWATMAGQENSQYNADRELAYNQAMAILSNGKMPSDDLLAMAGISSSDAKKLKASRGGSGGGGRSGGGSYNPGGGKDESLNLSDAASMAYKYIMSDKQIANLLNSGSDGRLNAHGLIVEELAAYKKQGIISAEDMENVLTMLGY